MTQSVLRLITILWTSLEIRVIFLITHIKVLRQADELCRGGYLATNGHPGYSYSKQTSLTGEGGKRKTLAYP
jgi:hypothetical protein